jgi:para-aminobenzoate synthetase component 1
MNTLNPFEEFLKVSEQPFAILLESALFHPEYARYSFVASNPSLIVEAYHDVITIYQDGKLNSFKDNPLSLLAKLLRIHMPCYCIGYLGYDLRYFIEKLPDIAENDLPFPDMFFGFYNRLLCFDHLKNESFWVENKKKISPAFTQEQYHFFPWKEGSKRPCVSGEGSSNFTHQGYIDAINRVKEYILDGDIYEVNLSQRFHMKTSFSHEQIYERLKRLSPAYYSCIIRMGSRSLISSSPEEFLFTKGRYIRTRPIKGTRKRGSDEEKIKADLFNNIKDNAELAMIVDLERNDLGKICRYGSVKVAESKVLETHPTVFHLSSTIEGKLRNNVDLIDIIKATFPGGSVTGCPKVRAMQIIEELEPTKRGPYTGAIGYIGSDGSVCLSMAIRIILLEKESAWFQTGGAIVADSDPESEYEETLTKASAIKRALDITASQRS